ncbi:MAG: zinc-ribbon domain-containing protein [Myxococcales bacterium]|nr:zinc-ribbon domain-containing protein [Myxococcales bacterium]
MKFLCPSCKAKYQIADDKVAGRSVRMKCRKCGYLISIGKAVTDGSVSRKLSSMPPPPDSGQSAEHVAPRPGPGWREPGARTSQPGPPPRPPPRARPGAAPVAPPGRFSAQGTAGVEPAVPRPPQPHSPKNGNGSSSHHHAFKVEAPPVHRDDDERTVIAGVGALSSAFAESVAGPESSALAASLAATDEWYVGINGVPVGPIRLSELRSKAASGAISGESLVWREGFEQWLPLANFPELVAIVEEGFSSARASLTPLSSPPAAHVVPPAAPRPEVYDPFALPGGTPVVAQDPFQEMLRPSQPVPEAFGSAGAPATNQLPLGLVGAPVSQRPPVESESVIFAPPKRSSAAFAWVAVGVALMLGLTIGFVMFSKKPPEPVVKYVEVPAKPGETPGASTGAAATPAGEVEVEIDAGGGKTVRAGGTAAAGTGKTAGEKPEEKPLTGLAGLQGLQGGGPTGGPGSTGSTGGGGGQPLDSGEIQKTVSKYTSSVKRSCWQPALDARSKDAPTSARVNVAIVVSPSGSVQSVSTSGDPKGYPGLASCIAARVKAWQFPASSGTTTVNVPFVFAAQ